MKDVAQKFPEVDGSPCASHVDIASEGRGAAAQHSLRERLQRRHNRRRSRNDQFYFDHPGTNDSATLQYAAGDGADTIHGFTHGLDTIDIVRTAGDPDPTVTASVSGTDTTVHIVWDASHKSNITLSGVQLSSFVLNQDYHLMLSGG